MIRAMRRLIARKLDPEQACREKALACRIFVLRDTLEQVAWRQAMNLTSVDQQAAYRLIHMRLAADAKAAGTPDTTNTVGQGEEEI